MSHSWPNIKYIEGENPFVTYARKQMLEKNNCLNLACTGGVGKGKSWASLSYSSMIDPDFDVNEQCFFRAIDLIKTFRDKIDKLKGKPYIFDESQIDANANAWQSQLNRGLNAFFSTSRHRNYCLSLCLPYLSFLSKGVRILMNTHFEAGGWTSDNYTKIKPRILEFNGDMDKFYRKRLVVKYPTGVDFVNEVRFPKPPIKIVREYEKIKSEFTRDLFADIADKIEESQKDRKKTAMLNLTYKQEEVLKRLKSGKSIMETAREMGDIPDMIYPIVRALRKKGIKIQKNVVAGKTIGYIIDDGTDKDIEDLK